MSAFLVRGGYPLEGVVPIHGAKNSVLPILAAALMNGGESVIENCPRLRDVDASVRILEHLGCRTARRGDTLWVDSRPLTGCFIPREMMGEMRSSVLFLGALLTRCGRAELFYPGGCCLGPRPIDLHLLALEALGAEVREEGPRLTARWNKPRGAEICLRLPSVGATENAMLAACGCPGVTRIRNAAREPEIVELQGFLNSMGACVRGAGTSTVEITGGRPLQDGRCYIRPDRIEAATYLAAAASAGGDVLAEGAESSALEPVLLVFRRAGCRVRQEPGGIRLSRKGPLRAVAGIRTGPWPGFPTDAQPPVLAALLRAEGESRFVETMFSDRYRHGEQLRRMGADLRICGPEARIRGVSRLRGASMEAPDLRGGAALVTAALAAEGESRITGLCHVDRGYEDLAGHLRALGACIIRKKGAGEDEGDQAEAEAQTP